MKTDVCRFEREVPDIGSITDLAAKSAAYNGLDKGQELKLTLLCEELVEMLPNLLIYGNGEFWIENNGNEYRLHTVVEADQLISATDREDILSVSTSGRNAAAVGIMNKIRIAAEVMIAAYAESEGTSDMVYPDSHYSFYEQGRFVDPIGYSSEWSLEKYRSEVQKGSDAWDELEKSIIANMADDVTVGIIGGKVEIVVKKTF